MKAAASALELMHVAALMNLEAESNASKNVPVMCLQRFPEANSDIP